MLPKCRTNFRIAVPSRSERRVRSAPSRPYHGTRQGHRGAAVSWQLPGMLRHLFKRPDASYLRVTEDMAMKLGLAIGYSGAHMNMPVALVQRAEELGYDSVWSAEAYGSDAITPLAFLAATPSPTKLGPALLQRDA